MRIQWLKGLLPLAILIVSIGSFMVINVTAKDLDDKKVINTLPTVLIKKIEVNDHQIVITSYGEVRPMERTLISAQVSAQVIGLHPNFVPGGMVRQGEVLFSLDNANYQTLVLQSESLLASAQEKLINAQAESDAVQKEVSLSPQLKHSDLYLRKPQVLSAQSALKSAVANLNKARRDLEHCDVKAPFDALVISRGIGRGQFINAGATVAVINNLETAEVFIAIAGFEQRFLPAQINGLKATVSQQNSPGMSREATLTRDLGTVEKNTRMSHLVVQINDPYGIKTGLTAIQFGSYVTVSFAAKILKQVYRLPQGLVNNHRVWVVNDKNQLQAKQVKVLWQQGDDFFIREGLKHHDQLVVTLPEYPQQGMQVTIGDAPVGTADITANAAVKRKL